MSFTFQDFPSARDDLRADVLAGLAVRPKAVPPKYFYDDAGCRLFDAICKQPEYALCRTEDALMARELPQIAAAIGDVECVIEPGAGDCRKVRRLVDALSPTHVVVIDIAGLPLAAAAQALAQDHPAVEVTALAMDFVADLEASRPWLGGDGRLLYYPGSSIGNFAPDDARALLARFRALVGADGRLLIGVDLKKDPQRLHAAYNDAAGVTAAFNLNLLTRLNRELGADFVPERFRHYAYYNPVEGRIEMHLVSLADQDVHIGDARFHFAAGETLHTEHSYKYRSDEFATLAGDAGWMPVRTWEDDGFAVQLYA